ISLPFSSLTGTLSCAQMPALLGDVTSGGGTCTTTITNNAVTNAKLAQSAAASIKGNPTNAAANATDFTIQGLINKPTPDAANDKLLIFDASTSTLRYSTVGQVSSAGAAGVTSLNGLTGGLSIVAGTGISVTPSGTNITVANTANPCTSLSLTGDVTSSSSCATTLATVNATPGTYGSATQVATFTVNAKGLVTSASNTTISVPFSSLTGSV